MQGNTVTLRLLRDSDESKTQPMLFASLHTHCTYLSSQPGPGPSSPTAPSCSAHAVGVRPVSPCLLRRGAESSSLLVRCSLSLSHFLSVALMRYLGSCQHGSSELLFTLWVGTGPEVCPLFPHLLIFQLQ